MRVTEICLAISLFINDARELKEKIELNCATCMQPNLSGRASRPVITFFSASFNLNGGQLLLPAN
jgi:hypothetical protein